MTFTIYRCPVEICEFNTSQHGVIVHLTYRDYWGNPQTIHMVLPYGVDQIQMKFGAIEE